MIVHYKLKNVLNISTTLRIAPGMNHGVNDAEFEAAAKAYPRVADLLESGDLEVVVKKAKVKAPSATGDDNKDDDNEGADAPSLDGVNVKDSLEIVKNTVDLAVLEQLLFTENRASVAKAIKTQIERVQKAMEPNKDDDNEGAE